ncbi:MAG: type II toxin-antitoxin system HicB family antitoxin [Candidatus Contendobacter sp.]|nr:type II toxin-antitoxin system HicB family antitoxin [Candidatus Contendobacter sp.]MDS4058051.1 type II toxin-antitoxin system HicB family antitoxin [Candidatus Contendobacter sp.]
MSNADLIKELEKAGWTPRGVESSPHVHTYRANPDFAGRVWAVVEAPVKRYFGPAEKINITLPRLLLAKIDDCVRARGETRSSFPAEAARAVMRQGSGHPSRIASASAQIHQPS